MSLKDALSRLFSRKGSLGDKPPSPQEPGKGKGVSPGSSQEATVPSQESLNLRVDPRDSSSSSGTLADPQEKQEHFQAQGATALLSAPPQEHGFPASPGKSAPSEGSPVPPEHKKELLQRIYEELRQVVDPEIGLNVVDLGLVYEVVIQEQKILLRMGLTTPLCPYGPELLRTAEVVVREATGYPEVEVEYVMDPPWNPSMMSPEARAILGMD